MFVKDVRGQASSRFIPLNYSQSLRALAQTQLHEGCLTSPDQVNKWLPRVLVPELPFTCSIPARIKLHPDTDSNSLIAISSFKPFAGSPMAGVVSRLSQTCPPGDIGLTNPSRVFGVIPLIRPPFEAQRGGCAHQLPLYPRCRTLCRDRPMYGLLVDQR